MFNSIYGFIQHSAPFLTQAYLILKSAATTKSGWGSLKVIDSGTSLCVPTLFCFYKSNPVCKHLIYCFCSSSYIQATATCNILNVFIVFLCFHFFYFAIICVMFHSRILFRQRIAQLSNKKPHSLSQSIDFCYSYIQSSEIDFVINTTDLMHFTLIES